MICQRGRQYPPAGTGAVVRSQGRGVLGYRGALRQLLTIDTCARAQQITLQRYDQTSLPFWAGDGHARLIPAP